MRKLLLCAFIISLVYLSEAVAQNHIIRESIPHPEIPRISAEMALWKYKSGKIFLVDAMNPKNFAIEHVFLAFNLPSDIGDYPEMWNRKFPFPENAEIIVYCN